MPHVVNGIGTWYYGKRRIYSYQGDCEFCERHSNLESYDTTLFFVVFFVPVIPIGQKRILQRCSVCQRHRVLSRAQWEEAKARDSAAVLEKLQEDPNDREALMQAIGFGLSYQDEPLFNDIVERLHVDRSTDALVQARLGDCYSFFGRWAETERAYRASMAIEDTEIVREALAWSLLRQERPDEARPYLQHILDNKKAASTSSIALLVEVYMSEGQHEQALEVLDLCEAAFPSLATNKKFKRQRKTARRYLHTDKKIRSVFLHGNRTGYREGGMTSRVPYLIALLIPILCALIYFGTVIWIGQSRKVYLVNGTGKPYSVAVQGKEYNLAPSSALPIHIKEGEVPVAFVDPKLGLEPMDLRIESNFWGRPFGGHTFIINPDQAAIVLEEESYYAEVNPPMAGPPKPHFGQGFYSLPGFDYEFQNFPPTLQAKKNEKIRKTRVALGPTNSPEIRVMMLQGLTLDEQTQVCKKLLRIEPNNMLILNWLAHRLPSQEAIAFVETRLDERPVLVEWHRVYQALMERAHPEVDLRPRYRKLLDENKNNPDALYLLGRADPDLDACEKLYQQAALANPPSAYALSGLGFRALCEGKFEDATRYFDLAIPRSTEKLLAERFQRETLLARKDYDALLAAAQREIVIPDRKFSAQLEMIRILAIRGDKAAALQKLNEVVLAGTPQEQMQTRKMLDATIAVCQKDVKGYLKAQENTPTFETAFLRGDMPAAEKMIHPGEHMSVAYRGLLFLEASRSGKKELATTHWSALLVDLEKEGRDERFFADLLAGRKTMAEISPPRSPIEPEKKRVLLTVLAERYPQKAKDLLPLAKRLDYQHDAVSLCLGRFLE